MRASPTARCSPNVSRATAIRSFSPSCDISIRTFRLPTMSISSSITMPPTNILRFALGWHSDLATTCTTRPPIPLGSIRWNVGLASSPSARFTVVRSPVSTIWSKKSMPSCSATIVRVVPLPGRRPPIRSCRKSPDFVHEFPGHNTRRLLKKHCQSGVGVWSDQNLVRISGCISSCIGKSGSAPCLDCRPKDPFAT